MEHDFVIVTSGNESLYESDDYLKNAWIARAMSGQGRSALGRSMAAPIRRSLDYQGIARKALLVEQLPPGASTIYFPEDK